MKAYEVTFAPEAQAPLAIYPPNGSEENIFINQALQKLGSFLQWNDEHTQLDTWAEATLQALVPFVKGLQGTFFIYTPENTQLHFTAGFAIDSIRNLKKYYQLGEGLIGQVAKDQAPLVIDNHEVYARLSSLKEVKLKTLMILPLVHKQKLLGVMEINFPQSPPTYVRNFIFKTLEGISLHLYTQLYQPTQPNTDLTDQPEDTNAYESVWKQLAMLTQESIVLLDKDWKIVDNNPAFGELFGDKNNEGHSFKSYLNVMSYDVPTLKERVQKGQTLETIGIHKSGHTFRISLQSYPRNDLLQGIIVRPLPEASQEEEENTHQEAAETIKQLQRQLLQAEKQLKEQMQVAGKVQNMHVFSQEMLQQFIPELFIFYKPSEIVGGDFYWFTQEGNQLVLACIDCTGKGVAGALRTLKVSNFLTQIVNVQKIISPQEILQQLHAYLKGTQQEQVIKRDGVEIGICTIDLQKRLLHFSGAKNNLIYFSDNILHEIQGDSLAVGSFWSSYELSRTFKNHSIALKSDTPMTFYLGTDGYEDQFGGEQGRKFLKKRLRELLQTIHTEEMSVQAQTLATTLATWQRDKPQTDDVLLMGFRL